jgi:hypothetical protein
MTALLKKASFYLNLAPLNKIPLFDNGATEIFHTFGSKNIESRRGGNEGELIPGFPL